ncbi:MAG TPA: hypothetical protein VNQ73_21850 [Ilumatobacter sp.]|nr:hypothetical protein [Ilumatobacter sp.]
MAEIFDVFGFRPSEPVPADPLRAAYCAEPDWRSSGIRHLADLVGGIDALAALDSVPFDDEPFAWDGMPDAERDRVAAVLECIEAGVVASPHPDLDQILAAIVADSGRTPRARVDTESVTIARRLLRRVADHQPAAVARSTPARTAAAIVWLALQSNGRLGRRQPLTADALWRMFGVSSCVRRGWELLDAVGLGRIDPEPMSGRKPGPWLAAASLLHSRTRHQLVQRRDAQVELFVDEHQRRVEARPVHVRNDGLAELRGRRVVPRWARVGVDGSRATVALMTGEDEEHAELLMLTVPDARALVAMLTGALGAGLPRSI